MTVENHFNTNDNCQLTENCTITTGREAKSTIVNSTCQADRVVTTNGEEETAAKERG